MPTVRIPVNQSGSTYTRVSIQDWVHLRGDRWSLSKGYARRPHGGALMHRVILGLEHGDPRCCDHIDRDPLNNTRSNIRIVTAAENMQNRASYRGSTSQYRGVSWNTAARKWIARGSAGGKQRYLGRFDSELEAARVAREFRERHMPLAVD